MAEQSAGRVGKTQPGEGNRKSLRSPKTPRGERPVRRIFPADYELSVLAEHDSYSEPGERGDRRPRLRRRPRCPITIRSAKTPRRERTSETEVGKGRDDHRGPGKSASALGRALQARGHRRDVDTIIDAAVDELANHGISRVRACRALGRSRATHYRHHRTPPIVGPPAPRPRSHRRCTGSCAPSTK